MAFLIFFRELFNKIDNSKCQNYPHKDCFPIHDIDFLQSKDNTYYFTGPVDVIVYTK